MGFGINLKQGVFTIDPLCPQPALEVSESRRYGRFRLPDFKEKPKKNTKSLNDKQDV